MEAGSWSTALRPEPVRSEPRASAGGRSIRELIGMPRTHVSATSGSAANPVFGIAKKKHSFPTAADVDDEAAMRLESAHHHSVNQRHDSAVGGASAGSSGGASAGSSMRQSSVPAHGIISAGGGMDSRAGIDHPTSLERGERIRSQIVDTLHLAGLLTPAVLGSAPCVASGLDGSFVLQHAEAMLSNGGYQAKPVSTRDAYNRRYPTTVFVETVRAALLKGGGLECGLQPMAAGAVSKNSRLRPAVLDTRGDDWDCGLVRGHKSPSPAEHARSGCEHMFFNANWCLKKGGDEAAKSQHLFDVLFTVATSLAEGRDTHVHCISLLFPSPVV